MRKLILAAGGMAAAATAVAVGAGAGHAAPGDTNSTLNVVGEPYAKAVAILRAQGVKATFGGSVGSDLPQAQCVVASQKVLASKMQLNLDCTAPEGSVGASSPGTSGASGTSGAPAATDGARPTPGAPGVVTVVPKQVG